MEALSRRDFLWGISSSLLLAGSSWPAPFGGESHGEFSGLRSEHLPVMRVPARTRNGGHVPIRVTLDHSMGPRHLIESIHVINPRDPIPSKGTFHFTPLNGEAYLATQVRIHSGTSPLIAIASCSRHGKWKNTAEVTIPDGQSGCATAGAEEISGEVRPPLIRIPELVRTGKIRRGQIAEVQVKMRHPNRTGLAFENGRFVQKREPYYVETLEIFYGGEPAGLYEMTAGISESPFIAFKLKFAKEETLELIARDNRGAESRVQKEIRLS